MKFVLLIVIFYSSGVSQEKIYFHTYETCKFNQNEIINELNKLKGVGWMIKCLNIYETIAPKKPMPPEMR